MLPFAVIAASYLLGSLSFAVIISRFMGLADPRSYGSKNPGATNMLRSGSKAAALMTLCFDAAKGAVPVIWVMAQAPAPGWGPDLAATAGLAAFMGHLYPVFFGFKGGKGVATAVGVLLGLHPMLALASVASFALVLYFSRYVSLASMVAAVFAPFYMVLGSGVVWQSTPLQVSALVGMSVLLVWRHRENARRLMAGTETPFRRS